VHDVWGGKALAYARLDVVQVTLDTALVGNVLAQIGGLSAGGTPQRVVLTISASGSVSDFTERTASVQRSIAAAAGVEVADVAISLAAGSVVITASIAVASNSVAGGVTVDTITSSLSSSLGTLATAVATLGLPLLIAPTWVVETAASGNNAAATQLVGALAATLNTQGSAAAADAAGTGVTDSALVELREGLFSIIAAGNDADAAASEAKGEPPDALAIAVTASAVEAVASGPQAQLSRASVEAGADLVNSLAEASGEAGLAEGTAEKL